MYSLTLKNINNILANEKKAVKDKSQPEQRGFGENNEDIPAPDWFCLEKEKQYNELSVCAFLRLSWKTSPKKSSFFGPIFVTLWFFIPEITIEISGLK